ncbi:MAG TPA: hypothetical protein VF521_10520, partial [Pyrinomonadaceae bacterium]
MHLRRALLLFALVLGLTALAASIAPAPKRDDAPTVPPTGGAGPAAEDEALTFRAPPRRKAGASVRRVVPGSHVTVAVA